MGLNPCIGMPGNFLEGSSVRYSYQQLCGDLKAGETLPTSGDDEGEPPASPSCLHRPIFIVFFIDTNGTYALCLLLIIIALVKMLSIPTKWFIKINSS